MKQSKDMDSSSRQTTQESELIQASGLYRSLLSSLPGAIPSLNLNMGIPSAPASSFNFLQPSFLPLSLGNGLPVPGLQPQFLAGRTYLSSNLQVGGGSLVDLASGIQALQGFAPQPLPVVSARQTGRPNQRDRPSAEEIQDALDTLASATAPMTGFGEPVVPKLKEAGGKQQQAGEKSLPCILFMDCDEESLSDYQCLLRKQIELFEATTKDVQWNTQGRNKPIVLGQVGIRCRHCANLPTWSRPRGSVYYSATLDGLYQAAQNMAKNHFCKHCRMVPEDIREGLSRLKTYKRRAAGGMKYWAEGAKVLHIYQCEDGLRFRNSSIAPVSK